MWRHGRGEVDLLENEEDYDGGDHGDSRGTGEEVLENECDLLEFSEDNYSAGLSFTIPEDAPLSYCDDHLKFSTVSRQLLTLLWFLQQRAKSCIM